MPDSVDDFREKSERPLEKQNAPRKWTSADLLGSNGEAHITHGEETYRLLLTRNNKLILVK